MVDKTKEALEMAIDAMEKSKRPHAYCEDTWYSCPKHEEGCADVRQGDECNCGADSVNLKLQKPINACKEALAELQQQSSMQQLEIMRLRETLENTVLSLKGYRMELSDNQPCDAEKAAQLALSNPATYDDLMAWHEAQFGEPVACIDHMEGIKTVVWKERNYPDIGTKLYAKKG